MKTSVVVVGGGIAGLSLAQQISTDFEVTVVEAEFQPGYHSTGRSAAVLHLPFENDVVHRLTLESVEFFESPQQGFEGIAEPLSTLRIGTLADELIVEQFLHTWVGRCPWLASVSWNQMSALVPFLSTDFAVGVLDPRSLQLNVDLLLDRTRKKLIAKGGSIVTSFRIVTIEFDKGSWRLISDRGEIISADIIVNAAGAWLDSIAQLAGIEPIGVQPKRRTGIRCRPDLPATSWPMCYRINHELYFKREGQSLMLSPCDATPSAPCDAQPEMIDIAQAISRLEESTTFTHIMPEETWAGLRTFVSDECPVIGYDGKHTSFFWYGAFGGFGVQTAPASSKIGAELLRGHRTTRSAVTAIELSPNRLNSEG